MFAVVSPYTYPLPSFHAYLWLTRSSVYTSHQKVVLEVDFNGSLWVCVHKPVTALSLQLRCRVTPKSLLSQPAAN